MLGTGTQRITIGNWYYIEVKVKISTTTGSVRVRVSGVDDIVLNNVNTHGDESVTSADTIDSIVWLTDLSQGGAVTYTTVGGYTISCNVTNNGPVYDDIYICDTTGTYNNDFMGELYVQTIFANGAGGHTQWTASSGTNFSTVNEVGVNDDTNYVSTSTTNNIDTYTFGDLTIQGVLAVNVNMISRMDDAGPHSIAPVVRIASTDYVGTAQSTTSSYANLPQIYETNPNTGNAWSVSDVNGAEFGIKMIS